MRKIILSMVMAMCMLCVFMTAVHAAEIVDSGECGDNVAWTLDSEGTLTISGTGEMENYSSPSAQPWYTSSNDIKNIIIKYGVSSIGSDSFWGCHNLTRINIPDSITYIGDFAFSYCIGLTDITIPGSVTTIGAWVFSDCNNLTYVSIENGVTVIGGSAFRFCNELKSIVIPDSVTYIGSYAFFGTAYYNNENNWSNDVLYINNHLIKAKSTIINCNMKIGCLTIAADAFLGCNKLSGIIIPDSITYIGGGAFLQCSKLTSIIIPDSITYIGSYTFCDCDSLKSLLIPKSISSIDDSAFSGCGSLTDVYYDDTENKWNSISIHRENDPLLNATIHYNSSGIPVPSVPSVEVTSTDGGYIFDINVSDIPYTCDILTALYDNGRLTGFSSAPVTSSDTQKTVTVPANSADNAKVFIWDALGEIKPLCGSEQIEIK